LLDNFNGEYSYQAAKLLVYEEMKKFSGKVGNKRNLWETIYYV